MDPISAIGLASSLLTFIDIGYKVVTGTLEIARTGQAPHTEHIDAVAHDLENVVARFSKAVSPDASGPEKALAGVSARCQPLSTKLRDLLERFKMRAAEPGISWDKFKVVIRRIRNDSKVQEMQKDLAEYRSQILVHLVIILNDRQLETQIQLGNAFGEARTDLRDIRGVLDNVKTEILDKFEQVKVDERSTSQAISDDGEPLQGQNPFLDKIATQFQEVKDALDHLAAGRSEKTPETRILEHVYFGNSMFQREETLKSADDKTFHWFVEDVSNEDFDDSVWIDLERTDREEIARVPRIGASRAAVASHFKKWLRSGRGVFHISGKAGSGKSTLMKLLLSTGRTHELLSEWAGGKRLLFARFYFWAGGDQMQNSLEGLQRSILFEVLVQRPDLVKEVFCEAYPIVANNSWDSPTHSRLFTTAGFQKAFQRLIRLPADPRYRLCLFIDGLDEFGADVTSGSLPEIQREDLAQSLADWASNDNVKILASSRPYPEFSDTFADDQRVHLHQLTYDDMIKFGHHLFERHRVFQFPGVKERYKNLVEKVVRASSGVFLWTGLTIQRLLASLARRDSFESLEKQLEATPRDLSVLYERMFLEIGQNDCYEAMKMMLLVSEERKWPHLRGVNALAIGWLEAMEDLGFPANQPFMVYTEDEIEEKRKFAETRVNSYTRGFLEVTSYICPNRPVEPLPLIKRHTVQFFHRTALEYVASSPLARDVLFSSTNYFNLEFYTRLALAELHAGSLDHSIKRHRGILCEYFNIPNPSHSLIEAYRAAFQQQAEYSRPWNLMIGFDHTNGWFGKEEMTSACTPKSFPFDHWVANEVFGTYASQYLTDRVQAVPELLRPEGDLSLLLSAACRDPIEDSGVSRLDRVTMILAHGADLHHVTHLWHVESSRQIRLMELSVWQAWCLYYVSATLKYWPMERYNIDTSQILELFLKTGVDSDCHILMAGLHGRMPDSEVTDDSELEGIPESDEDRWTATDGVGCKTAYMVSFRDFVRQTEPTNIVQLERLLGKDNGTQEFSTTELSEIEAELTTSKHPGFKSPTVRPLDVNQFFADSSSGQKLTVYWIRWHDATIPGRFKLRLY